MVHVIFLKLPTCLYKSHLIHFSYKKSDRFADPATELPAIEFPVQRWNRRSDDIIAGPEIELHVRR